jgi:hypothetical protein
MTVGIDIENLTVRFDEVTALDGIVGDGRRAKVLHGSGAPPDGDSQARRV